MTGVQTCALPISNDLIYDIIRGEVDAAFVPFLPSFYENDKLNIIGVTSDYKSDLYIKIKPLKYKSLIDQYSYLVLATTKKENDENIKTINQITDEIEFKKILEKFMISQQKISDNEIKIFFMKEKNEYK